MRVDYEQARAAVEAPHFRESDGRHHSIPIDALQAFVAVVEARSFTRAAVDLGRSQPIGKKHMRLGDWMSSIEVGNRDSESLAGRLRISVREDKACRGDNRCQTTSREAKRLRGGEVGTIADDGKAVVVISSYLPEIMALSHRILVTRQGKVVEEFSALEATEEKMMYAAIH